MGSLLNNFVYIFLLIYLSAFSILGAINNLFSDSLLMKRICQREYCYEYFIKCWNLWKKKNFKKSKCLWLNGVLEWFCGTN